jgi:hypothetical protein
MIVEISGASGYLMEETFSCQNSFAGIHNMVKVTGTQKSVDTIPKILFQLLAIALRQAASDDNLPMVIAV